MRSSSLRDCCSVGRVVDFLEEALWVGLKEDSLVAECLREGSESRTPANNSAVIVQIVARKESQTH